MKRTFKSIPKDTKKKFLKMLLMLFPNFRSARFKDNGDIIFKQRGWFKRRIKKSFTELLTLEIPKELCIIKYGNYSLLTEIYDTIKNLSRKYDNPDRKIISTIDYLYLLYDSAKIRNPYKCYSKIVIPSKGITNVIEDNDFVSVVNKHKAVIHDIITEFKLASITLLLTISLWLPAKFYILHRVTTLIVEVREFDFPFKIINTS